MTRSQRHKVVEQGYSSRGDTYEQGGLSPTIKPVVLSSISPTTAIKGAADLTLTCNGTDFTKTSTILFNNAPETTTFVSATKLTTVVKPSLASGAVSVPVRVQSAAYVSEPQTFTFTLSAARSAEAEVEQTTETTAGEPSDEVTTGRTFPLGPYSLLRVEPHPEGVRYVLSKTDGGNMRAGDLVRVEATGNTPINGDYEIHELFTDGDEMSFVDVDNTLQAPIEAKGRLTVMNNPDEA